MIILYNILFFIVIFAAFPLIIPIMLFSRKRRNTVLQRLGLSKFQIPDTKSQVRIWVHALSVGEVLSAVPLVEGLKERFSDKTIVFSASTETGFQIANTLLKKQADAIFFFPYDLIFSVRLVAKEADPALVVIVETDIWPNFLFEMKRRNVPVLLVNARLSKKSFSGYKRFSFFTESLFLKFSKVCAQSAEDVRRFKCLGVPSDSATITGNVKFDRTDDPISEAEIESLRHSMNIEPSRKIIVAGSTHKGEEAILSDAFSRIKKNCDLLLIIVPRDPDRAGSVCRIFKRAGFSAVTLSELGKTESGKKTDVIVIDTIGLLRRLYGLADIAYVGGSLARFGGHNPLEPAVFSKPILFGPDMSDFAEISEMLLESGGAIQVQDAGSFHDAVILLLTNDKKARKAGERAFRVFHSNRGAVGRTLDVIGECLKVERKS